MRFFILAISFQFYLPVKGQEAKIIKIDEFKSFLNNKDKLHVINFWATWCKPCVQELPLLLEAEKKYSDTRFIFISLDFKRQAQSLNSFLVKNNINSEVYLLDEPDYDAWINQVDSNWGGNIPATLIYKNQSRKFIPKELKKGELDTVLEKM